MAVISELIDAGLSLKEQGNHQAAIEHFRQLNVTYPDHARIMFELAGSWQAFNVPERALPLYQRLMAMPKSQGLPPKDIPRLYTQLGATLRMLGQFTESLAIISEGLQLYPDYRPLRAYHMFALHSAGFHQNAMTEALELMLESLAPQKWDLYEDEIVNIVKDIRQRVPRPDTTDLADWEFDEFWSEDGETVTPEKSDDASEEDGVTVDDVLDEAHDIIENGDSENDKPIEDDTSTAVNVTVEKVTVEDDDDSEGDSDDSFEVEVKVIDKKASKSTSKSKKTSRRKSKPKGQLGKKAVKIDIADGDEDENVPVADTSDEDDNPPAQASGKINIPIDLD